MSGRITSGVLCMWPAALGCPWLPAADPPAPADGHLPFTDSLEDLKGFKPAQLQEQDNADLHSRLA